MAASNAYRTAKQGGRNSGFLSNCEDLPDHLISKAIRSLRARANEHHAWIEDPGSKVGPDLTAGEIRNLVQKKWPKDIIRLEEQIAILMDLMAERRK